MLGESLLSSRRIVRDPSAVLEGVIKSHQIPITLETTTSHAGTSLIVVKGGPIVDIESRRVLLAAKVSSHLRAHRSPTWVFRARIHSEGW